MFLTFIGCLIACYYALKIAIRKLCRPKFTGKTIWITDGCSGLGEHLAYQFSKRDVGRLILSARNLNELKRVKDGCKNPQKVTFVQMDISDFQGASKITDLVLRDLQAQNLSLDIMIENAGASMQQNFMDLDFQNHLTLIDVNVNGVFNHIQAILPHMTKNKRGQIVTISSLHSKIDFANKSSYVASKFGLNGLMDSLRAQVYSDNITVTTIMPGYVQTNVKLNLLTQKKSERRNQNDIFQNEGMLPNLFAEEAIRAIYMKEKELHISKQWILNPLRILVRGVFPDLGFILSRYWYKDMIQMNIESYYRAAVQQE